MSPKSRRYHVVCILLVTLYLLLGAPLKPSMIGDQVWRRVDPPSLLDPNSLVINELNQEFETFFRKHQQLSTCSKTGALLDLQIAEIESIELFVEMHIEYRSDFGQYLAFDHLATDIEIDHAGSDDCDGRAILATSLLLNRGHDAWVLIGPRHYSVGVILSSGVMVQILRETGGKWWVLRFNDTQIVYNWPTILGKFVEGSYHAFIFLTLMLSILNREALYGKSVVLVVYLGFMTFFLIFV